MSLITTATVVSLLGIQMLNNPLDSNLGYDQVYFVYDSFDS